LPLVTKAGRMVAAAIRDAVKDAAKAPVKVKVVAPYRVVHEGKPFVGGNHLTVPAETADTWLKSKWVELVKGKK
jgi:ribosomal protein S5